MSAFPEREILKEKENQNSGLLIVSYCVESLEEADRGVKVERYSSTKELLLNYKEYDRGRVLNLNRRVKLAIWLGQISTTLNMNGWKRKKFQFEILGGRFLITGMNCLEKCAHKNFMIVAPGRIHELFMRGTRNESSSLWACLWSHEFVYYRTVV